MLLAITREGICINLSSRHLEISLGNDSHSTVPLNMLKRVIISGNTGISGAAIQKLLEQNIPVIVLSGRGQYLGQFHPSGKGDYRRCLLQMEGSGKIYLSAAQNLLDAKLYNQKRFLQRLAANRKQQCKACAVIDQLREKLFFQSDLDQLKGIEGIAARYYFEALASFLPSWCNFQGRNRRPAQDPVNAVMSYSYAVIAGEMERLIRLHAMDPGFGFLHCRQYNTSALTLDLIEPFRACFCDALTVDLFNHHRLRQEHFVRDKKNRGIFITPEGKRIFFQAWEKKHLRKFKYENRTIDWEYIWNLQVMEWLNVLENDSVPKFFKML